MTSHAQPFVPQRRITEREYAWNFVRAEIDSPRHGSRYLDVIDEPLHLKLLNGGPEQLDEGEWEMVERALNYVRGGYWDQFAGAKPELWQGELQVTALPEVRVIRSPQFVAVASNSLMGDFVRALDGGAITPGDDFSENYRRMRQVFDPLKMIGAPACVANAIAGPFMEIEGLTRLACLTSLYQADRLEWSTVPMIVGIIPNRFYRVS